MLQKGKNDQPHRFMDKKGTDTQFNVLHCVVGKTLSAKNMQPVILSGHHLLLTEAIKSITTEKFQKLFRHKSNILRARVELSTERNHSGNELFIAKGHLDVEGPDMIASAESDNMYKSIDLLVRKLDEQVRRKHAARQTKRKDRLAA